MDFTDLERNGIFLICGETGAGKTTILDAMCIALYNRASGGSRGELGDMRCKLAGKDDVTSVEFIFDTDGRRYQFTRSVRIARTNPVEDHQCLQWLGGEWKPLLANAKKSAVNEKAEEIIGLTYDQFRQVIILPQGQFERLLTSKSEEKEAILSKLFHTERWDQAVKVLSDRVSERDAAVREQWNRIGGKLAEFDCTTLDELGEKTENRQQYLQDLRQQEEQAERVLKEQRERQKQALLDREEFSDLAQREKKYRDLRQREEEMARLESALRLAGEAEKLRPVYKDRQEAEKALSQARSAAEKAESRRAAAAKQAEKARKQRQKHEEEQPEYDRSRARLVLLENAKPLYAALGEKKARCEAMRRQEKEKNAARDESFRNFDAADAAWRKAVDKQQKAIDAYRQGQQLYLQSIGGVLAEKLVPGQPCPVCGSRDHPLPAPVAEGHIADRELETLSKKMESAGKDESSLRRARGEAEQARTAAEQAAGDAAAKAAAAQAEYDSAQAGKLEGIDSTEQLEKEIQATEKAIRKFEESENTTARAQQEAEQARKIAEAEWSRLEEERQQAQTRYEQARSQWEEALGKSALNSEEQFAQSCLDEEQRQQTQVQCTAFRTELKNACSDWQAKQAALEGKTAPDMDTVAADVKKAESVEKELSRQIAVTEEKLAGMRQTFSDLTKQKQEYEEQRARVDKDLEFVQRLRGSAGVSLQRYVLGVRFAAVTAEANHLLETVYGGRYRLYRTDEASGRTHKKGLELEVYDTTQNQRRSVNTLSGGEKFLVALSLAIGLSSVVRAGGGGVHMEAMFVDEGFGSLDDKAIDDAVEILHGIRRNAGAVVGIISHVSRLQEIVPNKLEVRKEQGGSKILLHG